MVGMAGTFLKASANNTATGNNIYQAMWNWSCKVLRKVNSSVSVTSLSAPSAKIENKIKLMTKLGMVVHIKFCIWGNNSLPATEGAKLVVSDKGDNLSPK